MADKIKAIKIKQINGTYSEEIPISVNVQNVQWDENNHTLLDALGSVDISSSGKGNLQHQIDELDGDKISTNQFNSRLNDFLKDQISADTTDWLDDNVNPVGSAVIVDKTLTIEGAAADALAVKTELNKKANASNTYTKTEVDAAIDAKQIEVDDTLSITGTAADAKAVGDELTAINESLGDIIGGGAEQREIQFVYGSYINDGDAAEIGETVDLTNITNWYSLKHAIVECQEGDEFLIDMVGATNARAWAFLTSNNVLLSRSNANETVTGKITAPQNAGKVIIQGIYRQTQTDTSTDNGTAYKVIAGAGKGVVVRFDTAQDLTDSEKYQARENIGVSNSGDGLSYEAKSAILTCFEHVALWDDGYEEAYISALRNALFNVTYPGIVATYDNAYTVLVGNDVSVLKKYLTVKYYANASSSGETISENDYTLTGTISGSQNPITAIYNNFSSVFGVSAENYDNIRKIEYPNNTKLRSCLGNHPANGSQVQSNTNCRLIYITDGIYNAELSYSSSGELVDSNGAYLIYVPSWASKVTVKIEPATYQLYACIYNWYETSQNRTKQYDSGNFTSGSVVVSFESGHRYFLGVTYRVNANTDMTNIHASNVSIEFE